MSYRLVVESRGEYFNGFYYGTRYNSSEHTGHDTRGRKHFFINTYRIKNKNALFFLCPGEPLDFVHYACTSCIWI